MAWWQTCFWALVLSGAWSGCVDSPLRDVVSSAPPESPCLGGQAERYARNAPLIESLHQGAFEAARRLADAIGDPLRLAAPTVVRTEDGRATWTFSTGEGEIRVREADGGRVEEAVYLTDQYWPAGNGSQVRDEFERILGTFADPDPILDHALWWVLETSTGPVVHAREAWNGRVLEGIESTIRPYESSHWPSYLRMDAMHDLTPVGEVLEFDEAQRRAEEGLGCVLREEGDDRAWRVEDPPDFGVEHESLVYWFDFFTGHDCADEERRRVAVDAATGAPHDVTEPAGTCAS